MKIFKWIHSWFRQGARRGGDSPPSRAARAPIPASPRPERIFWLGGKPYVALLEGTSERDDYVMRLAWRAGLRQVSLRDGETHEQFALRLLGDLVEAGVRHDILGGLLIPRGVSPEEWTPALAENTAKHLRSLTDDEDKVTLNGLTASFLGDFFERELSSLVNSPTASGTAQAGSALGESRTATESGVA